MRCLLVPICSCLLLPVLFTGCTTLGEVPNKIADHTIGAAFQVISPYKHANQPPSTRDAAMPRDQVREPREDPLVTPRSVRVDQPVPIARPAMSPSEQAGYSNASAVHGAQTNAVPDPTSSHPATAASPLPRLPAPKSPDATSLPALSSGAPAASAAHLFARYKNFEYVAVLDEAELLLQMNQLTANDRVTVLYLAASAAYLLGDVPLACGYLKRSVDLAPSTFPSPDYFPSGLCALHEQLRRRQP
jgi:hypothetical protein